MTKKTPYKTSGIDFDYWDTWLEQTRSRQGELPAAERELLHQIEAVLHEPIVCRDEKKRKEECRKRKAHEKKAAKWRARRAELVRVQRTRNQDGLDMIPAVIKEFDLPDNKTGVRQARSQKAKMLTAMKELAEHRADEFLNALDEKLEASHRKVDRNERIKKFTPLFQASERVNVFADAHGIDVFDAEELKDNKGRCRIDHILIDMNGDPIDLDAMPNV